MNKELLPIQNAKKAAGNAAVDLIEEGMLVGLGTGSTVSFFIEGLGKRCKEGLKIKAVATSEQTSHQAQSLGIPLIDAATINYVDIDVDGADEIDHQKNMIKGGGGALLREKIIAQSSKEMVVVIDETKLVEHLGAFPVAVEIVSFAYQTTLKRLEENGFPYVLRKNRDNTPYVTDNKNYIADIQFNKPILNPKEIHEQLKSITGVLETGLFFNVAKRVLVGYEDGFVKVLT
jgi:ribose 5-phosphate isomerase A